MNYPIKILLCILLLCSITKSVNSQTTDYGSLSSLSLSKGMTPLMGVKLEQELRFKESMQVFNRSLSTLSVDYVLYKRFLKTELCYDYMLQHQNLDFVTNHRTSFAVITKVNLNSLDFELRLREQSTWKDQYGIDFKTSPNSVLRSRIECVYTILKSSVKPYFSTEITSPLNSNDNAILNGIKTVTGAKYQISNHSIFFLYFCCDQVISKTEPINVFYGGVALNYKM